jgi:hypothetical protein
MELEDGDQRDFYFNKKLVSVSRILLDAVESRFYTSEIGYMSLDVGGAEAFIMESFPFENTAFIWNYQYKCGSDPCHHGSAFGGLVVPPVESVKIMRVF